MNRNIATSPHRPNAAIEASPAFGIHTHITFLSGFALLLALQLILIWTHEPWLDEWQALQISLQSPSFAALLENLRYEGHPPLWYWLLQATALVVPPAFILPAIQSIIAIGIQTLIYFRAPFPPLQRLALGASFFVLIDFGTLSRSLSLGFLLLTIAVAFRRHKSGWAAIILLPFGDFLFGVLSMALVVLRVREKDIWYPGLFLWACAGIISAITVIPAADMVPAIELLALKYDLYLFVTRLSPLLIPLQGLEYGLEWNKPLPEFIALLAGPVFVWLGAKCVSGNKAAQIAYWGFFLCLGLFSLTIYPLAIRHLTLLAYWVILLRWWFYEDLTASSPRHFDGWLKIAAICGLISAGVNLIRPFDTAKQAGEYIFANNLQDKLWFTFPHYGSQGVTALTGLEFGILQRDCTQSFMRWNVKHRIRSQPRFDAVLHETAARHGGFYILTDFEIEPEGNPEFYKLLAEIPAGYDGQDFFLWRIAPSLPEARHRLPQCAPARKSMPALARH